MVFLKGGLVVSNPALGAQFGDIQAIRIITNEKQIFHSVHSWCPQTSRGINKEIEFLFISKFLNFFFNYWKVI